MHARGEREALFYLEWKGKEKELLLSLLSGMHFDGIFLTNFARIINVGQAFANFAQFSFSDSTEHGRGSRFVGRLAEKCVCVSYFIGKKRAHYLQKMSVLPYLCPGLQGG